MNLIVTRPAREAQRWVHDLAARGWPAQALPLIQVGPVDDSSGVLRAWQQLDQYVGVLFVSANAVEHFFALKPPASPLFTLNSGRATRAWSPGPGTAQALLRAGVRQALLDAPALDADQFDSEALWQVVATQVRPGDRVLVVRGDDLASGRGPGVGRAWFADRVEQAGGTVDFVVTYQRSVPIFNDQERLLATQAASDGSVWLFSSSQAVTHLQHVLPTQSWVAARALTTHPRIAAAAHEAGFGVVCASRPTLADVVASIESMS
ncbi:MAG: uroporphyrinogen-III synthase [Rhodoferax sp.]|jgi:uroporphyrinogen-III synthase